MRISKTNDFSRKLNIQKIYKSLVELLQRKDDVADSWSMEYHYECGVETEEFLGTVRRQLWMRVVQTEKRFQQTV